MFLLAAVAVSALVARPAGARAELIVSLTFDDALANQYQARDILGAHGMRGTFYVNSPRIGAGAKYMTLAQVLALQADGHEVGGHTLDHVNLTTVDLAEARRQVCEDRAALLDMGLRITSFAYPFGATDADAELAVAECGNNSGRKVGGIQTTTSCSGCPAAEPIPPMYRYAVRTPGSVRDTTPLDELKSQVLRAEATGGWLVLVMHHICDACDLYSVSASTLTAFLDWLQPRGASGTVVRTVHEVIGGPVQPRPGGEPPPPSADLLQNPSLETDANADGTADCWQRTGYGTNSYSWSRTPDAHSGAWAEQVTITSLSSGDRKLVTAQNVPSCLPKASAGGTYRASVWYKATASTRFAAYLRTSAGSWVWWAQSATFPPASSWTQVSFTLPAYPADATGLSFGFSLIAPGTLTVDDFGLVDLTPPSGGDTEPPTVALTAPAEGATVQGMVTLAAEASDAAGMGTVDFLVDGVPVGTAVGSPYQVTWDSTKVPNGPVTLGAKAVDAAGNAAWAATRAVTVDNSAAPPTLLQNPSLEADADGDGVPDCWQRGGFGTNEYSWSRSADAHAGSWAQQVAITTFASGDRRLISRLDAGACAPAGSPGQTYRVSGWYKSDAPVRLVAYYRDGAGVWTFWGQSPELPASGEWAQARWVTPVFPAGATHLSVGASLRSVGTLLVDDFDLAAGGPFDESPPSVSLTAPADGATVGGVVSVAVAASDDVAVASVELLVNGTKVAVAETGPYGFSWDSSAVADGPVTLGARAFDTSGRSADAAPVVVTVANGPPLSPLGNVLQNASLEADNDGDGVPNCWQRGGFGTNEYSWSRTADAHAGGWAQQVAVSSLASGDRRLISLWDAGACAPAGTPGETYRLSAWYKSDVPVRLVAYYRDVAGSWIFWGQSPELPASAAWTQALWTTPIFPADATHLSVGASLRSVGAMTLDDFQLALTDRIAPTVSLTAPVAGRWLGGPVTLAAVAADDAAVAEVEFLVNGVKVGGDLTDPYAFSWDSASVLDGPVTLSARALDSAGNSAESAPVQVTVANGPPPAPGGNMLKNASLEADNDGDGVPNCWQRTGSGAMKYSWSRSSDAHGGSWAQALTISNWKKGERGLLSTQDAGACAPAVVAGHTYRLGAWYKATAPFRLVVYYRDRAGKWAFLARSPEFAPSAAYAQATWTAPALPAGATHVSVGASLGASGAMTLDDFELVDGTAAP